MSEEIMEALGDLRYWQQRAVHAEATDAALLTELAAAIKLADAVEREAADNWEISDQLLAALAAFRQAQHRASRVPTIRKEHP